MQRRNFLRTGAVASLSIAVSVGTMSHAAGSETNAAKRRSIDAKVQGTMSRLYAIVKGSRELVAKANGVLVFPSVLQAGFVVGGQYGEGALRVAESRWVTTVRYPGRSASRRVPNRRRSSFCS